MLGRSHMVQNDLLPYIRKQFTQVVAGVDVPVDLTSVSVTFSMREVNTLTPKLSNAACTVVDALNGQAEYRWVAGDTDTVGWYIYEMTILYPGALPLTGPSSRYGILYIRPQIA